MSKPYPELVTRLHRSDVRAFDALYEMYHQAVYRNILKFTKNAIAAEDILQEVFIKLWEKRKQLKPEQSVAGWLFVISFNLSVNHMRKRLREQVMHKKLLSEHILDDVFTSGSIIGEEQYHLLEKAIEQLSPQKRKVINLCKLEGKTYDEAAAELHISRHTVKEHLSEAMVSLNNYVRQNAKHAYLPVLLLWLN